ncbi:MAG TPA: hypothetical protein HA341_03920 [Halobacteria archaeon]|jgi:heptaprenyl diphosphate synthase|nr:hypothetical protein [Halobacteria archaeon]
MDIERFVNEATDNVNSNIKEVISKSGYPYHEILTDTLKIFDKRWDAALEICGVRALGGDKDTAENVAAVTGLITQAIFVLDDVIDKTDKREGKTAAWAKYGINSTLITIHSLLNLSLEELIHIGGDKDVVYSALKSLDALLIGEYRDIKRNRRNVLTKDEYWRLCSEKAGEITKMFLSIASNFTNATEDERYAVTACSELVGVLSQVLDDLLDLEDDIMEGKTSLPIILLEEKRGKLDRDTMWNDLKEFGVLADIRDNIKFLTGKGISLTYQLDDNDYTGLLRDVFTLWDKFCSILLDRDDVDDLFKLLGEEGIERSFKVMFIDIKPEMNDDEINMVFDSIVEKNFNKLR